MFGGNDVADVDPGGLASAASQEQRGLSDALTRLSLWCVFAQCCAAAPSKYFAAEFDASVESSGGRIQIVTIAVLARLRTSQGSQYVCCESLYQVYECFLMKSTAQTQ